jgi:pyruvate/2-oxoglutarate dehydrogenase complex dihydrolipoamide acyltransferase (E2) component
VYALIMLKFGQTMEEGTIRKWLKQEGDLVSVGDAVAEVETDKVTMEITSEVSGVLKQIVAPENTSVPVLSTLAYIDETNP